MTDNRKLKIADSGDPYLGKVKPRINLEGKWLITAGFTPGKIVEVNNPEPGVLIVHEIKETN